MITISTQPAPGSLHAAYLPLRYAVRQTGVVGDIPPALVVAPRDVDLLLGEFPAGIDQKLGSAYVYAFDLSGTAAARIRMQDGLPSQGLTPNRELRHSTVALTVNFQEYAPGADGLLAATGNSKTSRECFVINAYLRADDPANFLDAYSRNGSPRYLTRRPRTTSLPLTVRDTLTVYNAGGGGGDAPTTSSDLRAVFTFYGPEGAQIASSTLALVGGAGSLSQFGFGPADVPLLGLTGAPDMATVDHYTVTVGRDDLFDGEGEGTPGVNGDRMTVYVEKGPADPTVVYFYNSLGVWEMALFGESTVRDHSLTGREYTRFGRVLTEERRSRLSVSVTSSTRTSAEADALLDLANSPLIYLVRAGRLLPVTLSASTLPVSFGGGSNGVQPFQFTLRSASETASQRTY